MAGLLLIVLNAKYELIILNHFRCLCYSNSKTTRNVTPDRLQPYLIDWLKSMVASQTTAYVVDPKLPEKPYSKELKRLLLVALRCVDPDLEVRPRMGEVLHMLEHARNPGLANGQCKIYSFVSSPFASTFYVILSCCCFLYFIVHV